MEEGFILRVMANLNTQNMCVRRSPDANLGLVAFSTALPSRLHCG